MRGHPSRGSHLLFASDIHRQEDDAKRPFIEILELPVSGMPVKGIVQVVSRASLCTSRPASPSFRVGERMKGLPAYDVQAGRTVAHQDGAWDEGLTALK